MNDVIFDEEDSVPDTGGGLQLYADLKISIDGLTDEMRKRRDSEQRRLRVLPRNYPITRISSPAGATDIQDFGGPQPGREWVVRLLVAAAIPLAANAALVTWYVGKNTGGPAAGMLPANFVRWQFPSVPGMEKFTSDVIVVRFGQNLIAGLTGVPASSTIAMVAVVDDQAAFGESERVAV